MVPITEIAQIPLIAGANMSDATSNAGKIWSSSVRTISQQDGYQRLSFGQAMEDPSQLILVVDWNDMASHQKFMDSAGYGPFLESLSAIVDGDINLPHVHFRPFPPSSAIGASSAPVTELLTAYLDAKDDLYAEKAAKFGKIVEMEAEGCTGVSTGFIEESVKNDKAFGAGEEGFAYISVIGWQSKDHHMAFRETEAFQNNINLCREGCKGLSVIHVSLLEY